MIFRFDDISVNSDMHEVNVMTDHLRKLGHEVWWAVSPIVSSAAEKGRVFPKIYTALSDHRNAYKMDILGTPDYRTDVTICSHGLFHIDHRLLSYQAQEMSILSSCMLTKSKIFVPPFNKWNEDTVEICRANTIALIQFEAGWLSCEHEPLMVHNELYYLHPYCFGYEQLKAWL